MTTDPSGHELKHTSGEAVVTSLFARLLSSIDLLSLYQHKTSPELGIDFDPNGVSLPNILHLRSRPKLVSLVQEH